MNYNEYQQLFEDVLSGKNRTSPYHKESYQNYTKQNQAYVNRWNGHLQLSADLVEELKNINAAQQWIIITEPWCGDAAHCVPFLIRMAEQNSLITYDIVLRDSPPFLIESYLTNGGKGIPKLIVRDEQGNDLFTWGPRPAGAQEVMNQLKADSADFETLRVTMQNWYYEDDGKEVCAELMKLLK